MTDGDRSKETHVLLAALPLGTLSSGIWGLLDESRCCRSPAMACRAWRFDASPSEALDLRRPPPLQLKTLGARRQAYLELCEIL